MTAPKAIQTTNLSDSTHSKPLLLLNDEQRRRRHECKLRNRSKSPAKSPTKSYIKNHEITEGDALPQHKSKSQQYTTHKLMRPMSKQRIHSKSGPPRFKKKKRTFKLSEPSDSIKSDTVTTTTTHRKAPALRKKVSRVFIHKEIDMNTNNSSLPGAPNFNRSVSYSPSSPLSPSMAVPTLSHTSSAPLYSDVSPLQLSSSGSDPSLNYNNYTKKKRSSFKLGDDSGILPFKFSSAAASFSSYQTKYKVHKPKIKPGSNQFLVNGKMRSLQAKLKREQREHADGVQQSFGKSLDALKSIKLPKYSGKIPLILIDLKKRLHSVDGLKQKKIFDVSLLEADADAHIYTSISRHHRIAQLIRSFFQKLPMKLLDNISIDNNLSKINHFKQIPDIVSKIPDPNKSILLWIWDLLSDTIEYQHENQMSYDSLSKSMAPMMITNKKYYKIFIVFFKYGIKWRLYLRDSYK